ncbi:MAG: dCTP deaminase [Candidatus Wallbacteria bacterium]|nr:dCTP deaminase [Candidatus Wallbacteria bacterium]
MIVKAYKIAHSLNNPEHLNADDADRVDPLIITPFLTLEELKKSGAASIDIRLGCWFLMCKRSKIGTLNVYNHQDDAPCEESLTKMYYVPFGKDFILHPKSFVLGVTLEWIRLPNNLAAYVVGRSSWGRQGLIIATATGVHPGFTGCLTLELTNVGEVPIVMKPGTTICQLFFHQVDTDSTSKVDISPFIGKRKPVLGTIKLDDVARKLCLPKSY